jgi:hypothetical protein
MSTDSFMLSCEVHRPDVVEWLQGVPPDKLPPIVENTLAAGHLALSLLQASTGEESMHRFFRPVLEPMAGLKDTIDGILRCTQKSQRLGELGEDIVAEQLKSAFPADDFEIVSQEGHQADIHANFVVGSGQAMKALVEVKLHSADVPTKEVEKFRKDLKKTGFRFGVMVSLTSRLAGIAGPLHLEETPEYLAVFVPNAGLDGHRLLSAVAMLKAIIMYQARTAQIIPTGAIEQAWTRLNDELNELKEIAAEVHDLRDSLQAGQQSLSGIFANLTEQAISAECRLHYALNRIANRLAEELATLPRTTEAIDLVPSGRDEVLAFLAGLRKGKDSRLRVFEAVYDLAKRLGLQVRLNDGHWQLLDDGRVAAWTDGTKTRLDACVPIDFDGTTEVFLDMRLEKLKPNCVLIGGTAPDKMIARLEGRLKQLTNGHAVAKAK